jgi:hypothetical protein
MIKNSGLGQLAEAAAGEDYYPVRRRGEKRRLNPNWAAIEWLEGNTLELTEERSRFLMSDNGGRYDAGEDEIDDLILVTKARGVTLYDHHSRPMFECFRVTDVNGQCFYADPCPDCDDYARSLRECARHTSRPLPTRPFSLDTSQPQAVTVHGIGASWRVDRA